MTIRTLQPRIKLLLDEMFAPVLAAELRGRGNSEWLLTENVKDFRPLLTAAQAGNDPYVKLLLTSSRSFPRSRRNPRPLTEALTVWLERPDSRSPSAEEWLLREISAD